MKVFRHYLRQRLADPGFHAAYRKNCAVCRTTLRLIAEMEASSLRLPEIAAACGISMDEIADLCAAETCRPASVRKLCDYFGISQPDYCLQETCNNYPQPDVRTTP